MKKSVAVLGLGKFGRSLTENLFRMGADVLAVDREEDLVNEIAPKCTSAMVANLANEDEVASLGLRNMDVVVTAMGSNLAASIMSIAVAKEQGVPWVVAKSSSDRMSSILLKVGADKILDPEGDGGARSARVLLSSSFRDYFEIGENMYIVEMNPQKEWVGKNLIQLDLRNKLNLNVAAIRDGGDEWHFVDPSEPFTKDCVLLIITEKKNMKFFK